MIRLATKKRVVIGHPHLRRGGSEARVMWLIEALKGDCDITVITTGGWNLDELNEYYGTHVAVNEVTVRIAPIPVPLCGLEAAALRFAFYQRFAQKIAGEYEIRISAYNFTNWGLPGIQFLADFSWDADLRRRLDPPSPGFLYRDTLLRRVYLKWVERISAASNRDPIREDLLVANSRWSAEMVKNSFRRVCAEHVYPPVWMEFPKVPWNEKEQAFVMIGRVTPEKRIERAVAILDAVRQRGHKLRLHLCGTIGRDLYGRRIAQLCRKRSDWIIIEGAVTGSRKANILASCRYGIQTRNAEPFGIAAAEMIRAGEVVFAAACGGQAEILDSEELSFRNLNDAVEKICSVLSDREKQFALRNHLAQRATIFSAQRFQKEVRDLTYHAPSSAAITPRSRVKVVIGHPHMGFGGSESVVMWLIEALKHDCEVTVLTTGGWNLSALNAYYGTQVHADEVQVRIAPLPDALRSFHAAALRGAWYQRFARQVAAEHDIRISAYNLTDWGLPAIHFLADFSWNSQLRAELDPRPQRFIYRNTVMRKAYLHLVGALGRPSRRDLLRDDSLVANSPWLARVIKERCGVDCAEVVYPPVWEQFPDVNWDTRELSFAMIGRIAPEKRIENAIQILQAVRDRGYKIKLHLCGRFEGDAYGRAIARLCNQHKNWIIREGQVTGSEKNEILSRCRFGIHTCRIEGFGISIAEMIKAGAIVFAPNDGAQQDLVGLSSLLFTGCEDAVRKICTVLSSPGLQSELRIHLAKRAGNFSSDRFIEASRTAISRISKLALAGVGSQYISSGTSV